ncbi:radical SAM protein [bacterium]|nr:radical SAM protein [bacterium]
MRVLLIYPRSCNSIVDSINMAEPLSLEYIASSLLKGGHEVQILDTRLEQDSLAAVDAFAPDIIGFTAYTLHVGEVRRVAKELKERNPNYYILVGGHLATVFPADFDHPAIDLIVRGDGTCVINEIVKRVETRQAMDNIPGAVIPGRPLNGQPIPHHPHLDTLPLPARHLTEPYRKHYFIEGLHPVALLRTSLGCPSRCNFCSIWKSVNGKYLLRDIGQIVEELKTIAEPCIYLADDESMLHKKRMEQLADMIQAEGIQKKFTCYLRVDTIVKHPDLIEKWRNIGLAAGLVGFEAFTDEQLKGMNKKITVEQQKEATRILKDLDIFNNAQFMVDPSYTRDDFRQLREYVHTLGLNHAAFTVLTPLPGTQLFEEKANEINTTNPALFDFIHTVLPTTLPLQDFYDELARLYLKAVPIRNRLPFILKRYGLFKGLQVFKNYLKEQKQFVESVRNCYRDHEAEA